MSSFELNDVLLAKLAGWEAVKSGRALMAVGRVLSSEWNPPSLRGVLQEGSGTLRAGLIIKSATDAENLCPCRDSRQRGLICSHSVAIGLHYLKSQLPTAATIPTKTPTPAKPKPPAKALLRANPDTEGEPLDLSIILPPNLNEALAQGRVMLYLEGAWRQGVGPLNTLPLDVPFALSLQEASLLSALENLNEGDTPAMLRLSTAQFAGVLPFMTGHPRVTLGRKDAVKILNEPLPLVIDASLETNGEITLKIYGAIPNGLIKGATTWRYQDRAFQPLDLPTGLENLLAGPAHIPRARVPQFLNLDWPKLVASGRVRANFALEDFTLEPATPRFKLHLAGGLAMLQATLQCSYHGKPVALGVVAPDELPWIADPDSPTRYRTRDFAAEAAAVSRLLKNGFTGPDPQNLFHLKSQNQILNFFAREFPRLEKEWDVTLEERLEKSTEKNLERIEPRFQITPSGEDWFNLNVSYDTKAGDRFVAADIQRLLLSGQSHTRLPSGKFALLDTGAVEELQEVLVDCAPDQNAQGYRLDNAQAGFLDSTLRNQSGWQVRAPAAWTERAAQQRGEAKLQPVDLGALESVLRPYQKHGVAWLAFLRANGFGGVLADEMGLGKTLQVLALLQTTRQQSPNLAPALVVCPTSLVYNWAAEAAKFTPGLRVLALHGPQRHDSFAHILQQDIVITSYALLRRDAEHYRGIEFDTVILDEAQHIKNRQTQNAQAVKSIRSRHRLVLTGTPLENSVLDLWSIFDFLMPGYLGNAADFRERYEQPIVREKNAAIQTRLARRLRPFLLRRLKRDVAKDLPEKIEQISYCELNDDQRALYQQILDASRREIEKAVDANGLAKSRMLILTTLLRLRQICCDLRLLKLEQPKSDEETKEAAKSEPSGKVELFGELLEEILDGGHKVLVFSQFTTMLGLLRDSLAADNIKFCYLDGSTQNRSQVVQNFQTQPDVSVFLISLKAGGVGLNLTAADTVIHFDPWWNPAVEAQATDRAHRIGQKKVVTSYKLITRSTVEEKILNLQNRKKALLQNLLGEEEMTSALSWNEIQDLLAN